MLPELPHQPLQPGPLGGRGALGGEADGQRLELPAHVEDVLGHARHGVAQPLAQHQRVEQVPLRLGGDDRALALPDDQQPPVDEQPDALAQGGAGDAEPRPQLRLRRHQIPDRPRAGDDPGGELPHHPVPPAHRDRRLAPERAVII